MGPWGRAWAAWGRALAPSKQWLAGGLSTFPLAVMLNEEGGEQILDSVISDGKSLLAAGDHEACSFDTVKCGECPSRLCNPDSRCCDLPCTSGEVDMVWSYGEGKQPTDTSYPIRSVMTAPFTTDPDAVVPRRLRSQLAEDMGLEAWEVGCGHAAHFGCASAMAGPGRSPMPPSGASACPSASPARRWSRWAGSAATTTSPAFASTP